MDYKDIAKAEQVLTKLADTFRAVQYLQDVLETLKPVVGGIAQYEAQLESKKAELETLKKLVAAERTALAEARIEKEKLDVVAAAIRAQLKGVGL